MDAINFLNIALFIVIGIFSILLVRKGEWVAAITLGALAFHGLVFNAVYAYRDVMWASCPPMCGLQNWSAALRTHSLLSIITVMLYRIFVAA